MAKKKLSNIKKKAAKRVMKNSWDAGYAAAWYEHKHNGINAIKKSFKRLSARKYLTAFEDGLEAGYLAIMKKHKKGGLKRKLRRKSKR